MKKIYIKLLFLIILTFSFGSSTLLVYAENETTSCFSQETLEWLEWFDSLSFNERLSVNYVPHEICVYLTEDNDDYPSEIENVVRLNNYLISGFSLNISLPDISNNRAIIDNPPAGGPMVTGGYEHNYDPTYWNNSSNINNANCYFYALNKRSSSTNLANQQIGYLSGGQISSLSASNLISLIQADISYMSDIQSIRSSSASEPPGYKEYKIALVTSSFDYHFYRQDSTAKWSHKMGHTGISQADNSNYYIYIPSLCNRNYGTGRNYSNFLGYYIVRYN